MTGVDHADFEGGAEGLRDVDAAGVLVVLPVSLLLPCLVAGAELAARFDLPVDDGPPDGLVAKAGVEAFLASPPFSIFSLLLLPPPFSLVGRSLQLRELLPLSCCSLSLSLSCLLLTRADWTVSHGPSSSTAGV